MVFIYHIAVVGLVTKGLNRFNAVNDDNALDQNYSDHHDDYLGQTPVLLALILRILILAILKVKGLHWKTNTKAVLTPRILTIFKNVSSRHKYWSLTHYIILQSYSTWFHVLIGRQKSLCEWKYIKKITKKEPKL